MKLSRRQLGKLAAGSLLTASVSTLTRPAAAAPAKKPAFKKTAGVVLGTQSYSFRDRPLDEAIAAMASIGLATCELWQGHLEPRQGGREAVRKWRLETPLSHFEEVAAKFSKAGVPLCAYNYSFKDDFSDEEIDRGFVMAKALGVDGHHRLGQPEGGGPGGPGRQETRITVAMHNHSKIDPNEFATPDDFEKAMKGPGRERIAVNLDIGHYTAANFDAVAFLTKHHARIVTLHIKDRKTRPGGAHPLRRGRRPHPPGAGPAARQALAHPGQHRIRVQGRRHGGRGEALPGVLPERPRVLRALDHLKADG